MLILSYRKAKSVYVEVLEGEDYIRKSLRMMKVQIEIKKKLKV